MRGVKCYIGVTESEVLMCHQKQEGQGQISLRIFGIALGLIQKQKPTL